MQRPTLSSELPYVKPWYHVNWESPVPPEQTRILKMEEEKVQPEWDPLDYPSPYVTPSTPQDQQPHPNIDQEEEQGAAGGVGGARQSSREVQRLLDNVSNLPF